MKYILGIIIIILILSCNYELDNRNEKIEKLEEIYTLAESGIKYFILDSVSSSFSNYIQFIEYDSLYCLLMLNDYDNSISFYNYENGKHYLKIRSKHDMSKISSFLFHNFDTIFLHSYTDDNFFIMDSMGNIYNQYKYIRKDVASSKTYSPCPLTSTSSPMILCDSLLFSSGMTIGEFKNDFNRKIGTIINLNSKGIKNMYCYPELYFKGNWGGLYYRFVYHAYVRREKELVLSFPADHYVYTSSNFTDKLNRKYAGSKYIKNIKSLYLKKSSRNSLAKSEEHFILNPSYHSIVYDKYRNVFYRFALLANEYYDAKDPQGYAKTFSIVILDKNLKYVGEYLVPFLTHDINMFFVSKDGLLLKSNSSNDDTLKFSIFKLKKIPDSLTNEGQGIYISQYYKF